MPTAEQIKTFLVGTVVPPIAGALATWISSTQVLSVFHITSNAAAAEITQVLVFGIVTGLAWLTSHHILRGTYTTRKPVEFTARETTSAAEVHTPPKN